MLTDSTELLSVFIHWNKNHYKFRLQENLNELSNFIFSEGDSWRKYQDLYAVKTQKYILNAVFLPFF